MDRSPSTEDSPPPLYSWQARFRRLIDLQAQLGRIAYTADADRLHEHLLRQTAEILEAECSALTLLDETRAGWLVTKFLGENGEWNYQVNECTENNLTGECLGNGRVVACRAPADEPLYNALCDGFGERAVSDLLFAPLSMDQRPFGVLKVANKRAGRFNDADRDLLELIAVQAAGALTNLRQIQRLKVMNADLEAGRWELLSSRNTLRSLFDNLPAALYIIDPDYRLLAVNRARTQRNGLEPRRLVGQVCYQALFNRSEPCPDCRVMETLRSNKSTQRSERRYVGDDIFDWEISSHPVVDENERVMQAVLVEQDNTERRRLEAILTQSEKLAAIGQLAASVAHEISNPLTAIIANAQILRRELPGNSDLQVSVDLISRAGARAAQVVRNLLDFARKEDYALSLTDLNETIDLAIELIHHEILARGVRLEFTPDPDLPPLLASPDHLQSVWLNLMLNAIDSIDKTPGEIKIVTRMQSGEIQALVSDNGKGIPADRLTRIFEPFYTTKAVGRGTGLGLSVSYRVVQQHGGRISVESQLGVGSVFTVSFPVT